MPGKAVVSWDLRRLREERMELSEKAIDGTQSSTFDGVRYVANAIAIN